jgi:D-alanyl-D-alanine carboxypeptidase
VTLPLPPIARVSRATRNCPSPILLGMALLAATLALPALAAVPDAAAVAREGDRLLQHAIPDAAGPGMAVLVARGEELLFRGARGMASIEHGVPLGADHVFRIGSVTKQFSAAGLLKLIDDGRVAFDDPLSKYLPDYPNGAQITIAQLLNHTSGIQSYTSIPGYMDREIRRDLDTGELIAVFKDHPVEFAPGEGWNYNNSGYVLVGAVIEQASGVPWDRWLRQSVFEPLGLAATRGGASYELVPRQASGYSSVADGQIVGARPLSMTQPHAAGALLSTVDDLWRWNRALHGGQLLPATSYQRMIRPEGQAAADGRRYGYGIQLATLRGRSALVHGGGIHGFVSTLIYLPDGEISVAVLRNSDGAGGAMVGTLARRLAAFALGDPYMDDTPIEVAASALTDVEGVYRLDADNTRRLRVVDGVLTSLRTGGQPFPLRPVAVDTFVFDESLSYLVIERDATGAPTAMRFFAEGEGEGEVWPRSDEPMVARAALDLPEDVLRRLVGDYQSTQIGLKVFFDEDRVLRVQVPGQPALALKAESPNLLYVTEVDASLEFAPADGPVETATLVQGNARLVMKRSAR